ncbi:MAG: S9 family peptidase [Phycisphaerales bacterium]|nr:S9 family peptidase [Phycisphaerales bacterium]
MSHRHLPLLSAAIACVVLASTAFAGPPSSRVQPVIDDYHGTKVVDEYRWLEGGTTELDTEVAQWTAAQNAYTREVLDNLPGRDELSDRLRGLLTVGSISVPSTYVNRYFYTKRTGDQNQPILFCRVGHDGEPRVLLDPNTLHDDGLVSLDWHTPNHDGSLLAFGISESGSENSTLHIMDVQTGAWLKDEIPNRAGSVNWFPDSTGFIYAALADVDDPYSGEIRYHELGTDRHDDQMIWKQFSQTWGPWVSLSRDARWMIAGYWTGTNSNDLWVVDADKWKRTGEFERIPIAVGYEDVQFNGPVYGDTLYLMTTLDHKNGEVYAVDLNNPHRSNWKCVIPGQPNAILQGVTTARGMLVATYLHDVSTRIERFTLDGTPLGKITLPGIGSAGISTDDDRTEAFLKFSSFNQPATIYRIDLKTDERELWAELDVPVDPTIAKVSLVRYESNDGEEISMFLVHRKDLKLTGDNPVLMYGYGGFNNSMTPFFWSTKFDFMERGGVLAVPHLRGGGEYGQSWHKAGMLENKQNTFDDFIAAAEWLIEHKYTNPDRLAVMGGSNGGLLTGAFLVQRPDLCKAVICSVPLLDMLRYQHFLMARYWVGEYGSSENPEQFDFIHAYSPYQHIQKNRPYPAVFLDAGEHDSRVHPLHARKMTAALQAATTSDPGDKPIILWIDQHAGHGQGKPFHLRLRDSVDFHIFLYWQLGLTGE